MNNPFFFRRKIIFMEPETNFFFLQRKTDNLQSSLQVLEKIGTIISLPGIWPVKM